MLAMSLHYEQISLLAPLLTKSKIQLKDFLHFDQELIFLLLQAKIQIPISFILSDRYKGKFFKNMNDHWRKENEPRTIFLEKDLFEELSEQDLLEDNKIPENEFSIREKTQLETVIENDDIESFRILMNDNTCPL